MPEFWSQLTLGREKVHIAYGLQGSSPRWHYPIGLASGAGSRWQWRWEEAEAGLCENQRLGLKDGKPSHRALLLKGEVSTF